MNETIELNNDLIFKRPKIKVKRRPSSKRSYRNFTPFYVKMGHLF
jgi:hypothetical protein